MQYLDGLLDRVEVGAQAQDGHSQGESPIDLRRGEEHATVPGALLATVVLGGALQCLGLAEALKGNPNRGSELLITALKLATKAELDRDTAETLESLALAAGAMRQHARAARLWGAAVAIRGAEHPWYLVEWMLYEPLLDTARSQTDEAIWDAAFAEGKAMSLEEAIAYALSEERSDTPLSPSEALERRATNRAHPA